VDEMNERIKSLMDRAEYQAKKQSGYEDWEVYVPPDSQTVFEKFAQLLIEECVTCVKYTDKDMIFTAHDAGVVGAAHDRAIKAIRKHFGVE
jgi:hypothetical protein